MEITIIKIHKNIAYTRSAAHLRGVISVCTTASWRSEARGLVGRGEGGVSQDQAKLRGQRFCYARGSSNKGRTLDRGEEGSGERSSVKQAQKDHRGQASPQGPSKLDLSLWNTILNKLRPRPRALALSLYLRPQIEGHVHSHTHNRFV